jgi:hypothetical protein
LAEALQVDLLLEPLRPPLVSQIHTAAAALRLCEGVGGDRLPGAVDSGMRGGSDGARLGASPRRSSRPAAGVAAEPGLAAAAPGQRTRPLSW